MMNLVTMTVNGRQHELAVDPRESLLETLRGRLGLTSVKKGCEVGECGACTVLVDGKAVDSCIYLTMWANGKRVMTVEGLKGLNGELSPIQQAFIDEAAVQCGFCTPGLIMTAVELVGTGKTYTREELKKQISGHLCRCTGYENILNAMERIVGEKREDDT
ncbi:MAG: xanthine dehydrogenase subunit XdhC [Butyricicoccus sp.]